MVEVRPTRLDGVVEIIPRRFADERGFFAETYSEEAFRAAGLNTHWVQDNHSLSRGQGVLRGLHFQRPPHAQAKLVRVSRGAIFDVAVDLRSSSPTCGQWVGIVLDAAIGNQLFVPQGFAHGFVTLQPDCEVQYKVSAPYSAADERSIRFDDSAIGIDWPDVGPLTLSDKDRAAPGLAEVDTGF